MKKNTLLLTLLAVFSAQTICAAVDVAPEVPDLMLPTEETLFAEEPKQPVLQEVSAVEEEVPVVKKTAPTKKKKAAKKALPPVTQAAATVNTEEVAVENLLPVAPAQEPQTVASSPVVAEPVTIAAAPAGAEEKFEPARDTNPDLTKAPEKKELKVLFNPPTDRDPTLSVDDTLLLKHREEERLRAIEAERQRKIEAERRRLAEIERQRQLELERLRDPSREIRGKIRINGIIGQEVFIGDRVYGVGSTVLGARIVQVLPESVVFTYKGQKFTKKVQLK
ncbi:MAG: hypothetical protein IJ311_02180 [Elusimicrobiaceae bacterium]|nr:hypothetical protein [Elusimicrobiaceae bacterium]